jgi:hypothetical protein
LTTTLTDDCVRLREQRLAVSVRIAEIEHAESTMRRVPESLRNEHKALVERQRKLLDEWVQLGCGCE